MSKLAKKKSYISKTKTHSKAHKFVGAFVHHIRWWPPYWPTGRLADNRKMRSLADNLSKMSNKINSEAVIGQFKSLFRKRTNIPSTSVKKIYRWSQPLPSPRQCVEVAATERPSGALPDRTPKIMVRRTFDIWRNESFLTDYDKTVG